MLITTMIGPRCTSLANHSAPAPSNRWTGLKRWMQHHASVLSASRQPDCMQECPVVRPCRNVGTFWPAIYDVYKILLTLNGSCGLGPYGLSISFLQLCPWQSAHHLLHFYQENHHRRKGTSLLAWIPSLEPTQKERSTDLRQLSWLIGDRPCCKSVDCLALR